ncbi:MAG: L-seryl-tRNA(Sec) selenium transferase [Clostridia bacterium]|nr:L-seryl-tRNA(Sec) selenium transferase [Clostridia bacterium]
MEGLLRRLPPVHAVLTRPEVAVLTSAYGERVVKEAVVRTVDRLRRQVLSGGRPMELVADDPAAAVAALAAEAVRELAGPRLRRVINATGVVLHTNLGRAVLAREACRAVAVAAAAYTNLEYDLASGRRGSRQVHVEPLLRELTGAEAAFVVNNNAAAVLLLLSAVAAGREAIVSRGQLVEIGGSFRVPEVMAQSGARLVEVGTTNRTRLSDYEAAIGPETAALLHVHPSNFRIVGFTASVPLADLVALGRRHGIPVLVDLGSGVLVDLEPLGLHGEPTVRQVVATGAAAVTFSGDKLLGGPQAGILVGERTLIERCRRHPLARALRVDKLTLAALEATLRLHLDPARALREVPTLRSLARTPGELAAAAERLRDRLQPLLAGRAELACRSSQSVAGGGSLPAEYLPTTCLTVRPLRTSAAAVAERLRHHDPPVVVRTADDLLWLDPRTLLEDDEEEVVAALLAALEPA